VKALSPAVPRASQEKGVTPFLSLSLRYAHLQQLSDEREQKLEDSKKFQQFLRDVDEVRTFIFMYVGITIMLITCKYASTCRNISTYVDMLRYTFYMRVFI